jgi:hypothetical protein
MHQKSKHTHQIITCHSQGQITLLIRSRWVHLVKVDIQFKFNTASWTAVIANTFSMREKGLITVPPSILSARRTMRIRFRDIKSG